MWLRSKQSSFFSFYALPSGGKSKDAVVHFMQFSESGNARNTWQQLFRNDDSLQIRLKYIKVHKTRNDVIKIYFEIIKSFWQYSYSKDQ